MDPSSGKQPDLVAPDASAPPAVSPPGKRVRHWVEYVLARAGLAAVDALPLGVATRAATPLADLWFLLHWSRRRVAIRNVLRAGICATWPEARRVARDSFRHFAVLIVETLKADRLFVNDAWRERVTLDMPPELKRDIEEEGKGIIVASGHFGNWEISAQVFACLKPVAAIARHLSNPRVDELMRKRQPRHRLRVIPKKSPDSYRFFRAVRRGEALAFMIDQHGGKDGVMVDFFGIPTSTHAAVALLPLVTRRPLYFGACRRTGPMRYHLELVGPIACHRSGDRNRDALVVLQQLHAELERVIRAHPEQYLWAHRRWRDTDARRAAAEAGGQ